MIGRRFDEQTALDQLALVALDLSISGGGWFVYFMGKGHHFP
jgi:hypothetical protein